MRRVIVHMQTTLDHRIANGDGGFWEPFPWGDVEMAYLNEAFRRADTWVMGRHVYEAVVPWWEAVARGDRPDDATELTPVMHDFASILAGLDKVVISRSIEAGPDRAVLRGDLPAGLAELKAGDGPDIILSCGPSVLAPIAAVPGLVDEYLVVIHPAVLSSGPRLFGDGGVDLALRLVESRVFDGGAVVLRYAAA